ncbi:MAG: PepSY domain-containing protein, partial [Syntrophomonadaceae bacterium]|nr:PepSY domain-containing protein [Syntrophomonadaceae bacterium]
MRKLSRLKMKRILAGWMVLLLLAAFFPGGVLAAEKPSVTLEQAIRIVKDSFPVPAEYKEFSSGFGSYRDYQAWSLNWKAAAEPGGSFHAEVDAVTGEILNISTWKPDYRLEPVPQKPAVSVAQARQTAVELLNRLAAGRLGELQLVSDGSQPIPLSSYGGVVYSFRWQRMVDGIPFPENGVTIGVSGDEGRVNSYLLNWYRGSLPPAAGVIDRERVQQVFKDKKMLELQYFLTPTFGPLSSPGKQQVMLIYRLSHPSQGIIDAFSGEPIEQDEKWFGGGDGAGPPEMAGKDSSTPANYTPLTPEEQREVEKTAKVISQEQAIAEVKRWVTVPSGLALRNVQMETDWQTPEVRIWSLYWSNEKAKPGQFS